MSLQLLGELAVMPGGKSSLNEPPKADRLNQKQVSTQKDNLDIFFQSFVGIC